LLDVHYVLGGITLRKDGRFFAKINNLPRYPGGVEKALRIKSSRLSGVKFSRQRWFCHNSDHHVNTHFRSLKVNTNAVCNWTDISFYTF
jgi:hypothetical protein